MISLTSFFQSLGAPSQTCRQISSLTKEIRRIQEYVDHFDKDEFEADFILTSDLQDLTDLDAFEHVLNMRTLEHIQCIFNYMSILNKKLEELKCYS